MKRVLRVILFSLISLLLLTSMLITAMFGNVKAEYFKSLSTSLDFEAVPDSAYRYFLADATGPKSGAYENGNEFEQSFTFKGGTGSGVRYHIALPIKEAGTYELTFTSDIAKGTDFAVDYYTADLNNPVGCQIVSTKKEYYRYNSDSKAREMVTYSDFGTSAAFRIADETRIPNPTDNTPTSGGLDKVQSAPYMYSANIKNDDGTTTNVSTKYQFYANSKFQWKTVAPARKETVTLSFAASSDDVTKGYALWMWDFHGLATGTYTIRLEDVSFVKIDSPEAGRAYIDFPNMSYKNMAIMPTYLACQYIPKEKPSTGTMPTRHATTGVQGHNVAGITRECGGRGTYVTRAGYDGMVMQTEPLYYAFNHTTDIPVVGSDDDGSNYDYSNPLVLNIPVKNAKYNTSYKVTFDFSIASQGTDTILQDGAEQETTNSATYVNYTDNLSHFFSNDGPTTLNFQSYFYPSRVNGYGITKTHTVTGIRGYYRMANKQYNTHWLTRYDEITAKYDDSITTKAAALTANVTTSINQYYTDNTSHMNWLNALKHSETNGQNDITWLTFKNTTFTFNINGHYKSGEWVDDSGTGLVNNGTFYWVWCIDALQPSSWFRIKMENVRIEEVVPYASNIGNSTYKGIKVGSAEIDLNSVFNNSSNPYRGSNGTGQNFAARHYGNKDMPLAAMHIYAPVYNGSGWNITSETDRYKLYLSGYCMVKGGVDRYVWSPDNGKTWYDMIEASPPGTPDSGILTQSEYRVDNCIKGVASPSTTGNYVSFTAAADGAKADFRGYRIYADFSEFKYQKDLDIIFAAVPKSNLNLRCEILRVEGLNAEKNYRTYTDQIISDITVGSDGNFLNATVNVGSGENTTPFSLMYARRVDNDAYSYTSGYARLTTYLDDYANVRTLYSDFPVKTTIKVSGWAIVKGGVNKYMWSADYGKTWNDCSGTVANGTVDKTQRAAWYDGTASNTDETATTLSKNMVFTNIAADLSDYVGKTVDVIFAARPTGSDAMCPVARIDNVAVYGDPSKAPGTKGAGPGPFYSRYYRITVGSTLITPTTDAIDGTYLNGKSSWNIDVGFDQRSYTPYEPYNVNYMNARSITKARNAIAAGGTVTIDGYINCYSGVKEYRYTLDGGNNWTVINQTVPSHNTNSFIGGKFVDVTFTIANDGANSNFCTNTGYGGTPITVTLPSGVTGNKDLRVVAVSNAGYTYPVVNIPLSIT